MISKPAAVIRATGSRVRWQHRLEPMQKRLADGCHLTRDPVGLVTAAGFEIIETSSLYGRGPKPWMYFTEVQARKPE